MNCIHTYLIVKRKFIYYFYLFLCAKYLRYQYLAYIGFSRIISNLGTIKMKNLYSRFLLLPDYAAYYYLHYSLLN